MLSEYQNIKRFLPKVTCQIGLKKFQLLKKLKYCTVEMCNSKENIETFYEKELQKINQKNLKLKKIKRKVSDKLYVNWKGDDN